MALVVLRLAHITKQFIFVHDIKIYFRDTIHTKEILKGLKASYSVLRYNTYFIKIEAYEKHQKDIRKFVCRMVV